MSRLTDRRPSAALLVSILALVVALGGTAYAAVQLPKNSVKSLQVKNGSLKAKDLDKEDISSVTVAPDKGPVTITAPVGDPVGTEVRSMALSKGVHQVGATVYVINDSAALPAEPRCYLRTSGAFVAEGLTGFYLLIPQLSGTNPSRAQFRLEGTVRVKKGSAAVTVTCTENAAGQNFRVGATLSALKVLSAKVQP